MTTDIAVTIFQEAIFLVTILVLVIVLPGLLVGLVIAVLQAATSINEQTLSFLPRLIATFLTLIFLGHWVFQKLIEHSQDLIFHIPEVIG